MLRLLGWLFGFGMFCLLGARRRRRRLPAARLSAGLPDYTVLKDYQPPVTTRVHAADGTLLAEYARERRLFQPIETIPPLVINAFISAEDKDFYSHGGIAVDGIIRALRDNIMAKIDGNDAHPGRRLDHHPAGRQELPADLRADLGPQDPGSDPGAAHRAHLLQGQDPRALPQRDLPRASNSYGVAAAALNYFDKALYELTPERGGLSRGACPRGRTTTIRSAPAGGHRAPQLGARSHGREWLHHRRGARRGQGGAAQRRSRAARAASSIRPSISPRKCAASSASSTARTELYGGGLSVRTTLDPKLQEYARKALMDGLINYDHNHGFRGPVATVDMSTDWGAAVERDQAAERRARMDAGGGARDGRQRGADRPAARTPTSRARCCHGARDRHARRARHQVGEQEARRGILKVGDVVYVSPRQGQGRHLYAGAGPRARGRARRHGSAHRPRAGDGRRLLLRRIRVQPRDAGAAPARLVVQADRLFGGARQWLHAGLGGARRADRDRQRRRLGLAAGKLRAGSSMARRRCGVGIEKSAETS